MLNDEVRTESFNIFLCKRKGIKKRNDKLGNTSLFIIPFFFSIFYAVSAVLKERDIRFLSSSFSITLRIRIWFGVTSIHSSC